MATTQTPQAKICAGSQNQPLLFPTRMGLFHHQYISQSNIHAYFPFIASQYCLAACSSLLLPY